MKRLVIFDLDGTLLNSIADIAYAANEVLRRHAFPLFPVEDYRFMVGNGFRKLMERATPEAYRTDPFVDQMRDEFAAIYSNRCMADTVPYLYIPELLSTLRREGIAVAVASNKYHRATQAIIAHYFPTIDFHAVYGQREGIAIKPDPTIVFDILGTDFQTSEVLYVGDTAVDMQTAANAGIESVGVTWGFRPRTELEAANANNIVDNPFEIIPLCR